MSYKIPQRKNSNKLAIQTEKKTKSGHIFDDRHQKQLFIAYLNNRLESKLKKQSLL